MKFTISYTENRYIFVVFQLYQRTEQLCEVPGLRITGITYELPISIYNIAFSVEKQTKFSYFFKQNVNIYLFE